jgi:hypothetical protein
LNDLINLVIQKYSDIRDGKQVASISIDKKAGQNSPEPKGFISLIDFDDVPSNATNQPPIGGFSHDLGLLNFNLPIDQTSNINREFSSNYADKQSREFPQNIPGLYSKTNQLTSSHAALKSPVSMTSKSILKKSEICLFPDGSTPTPTKDLKHVKITTPPKNSNNLMGLDLMSDDISMMGYQNDEPKNATSYAGVNIFEKDGLLITLQMIEGPNMITNLKAFFTNSNTTQLTGFNFQVAVPKVFICNC